MRVLGLLLLCFLALGSGTYIFDSDIHLILNSTFDDDGNFHSFDVIYDYAGITSVSVNSNAMTMASTYASNLTAVFLSSGAASYYADIVSESDLNAPDIYEGTTCMIGFDTSMSFLSTSLYSVTLAINGSTYYTALSPANQVSTKFLTKTDQMVTMVLTVVPVSLGTPAVYDIQFGYQPIVILVTFPSFVEAYVIKLPVFIVGTTIYLPATSAGSTYVLSLTMSDVNLNIRDNFSGATSCMAN